MRGKILLESTTLGSDSLSAILGTCAYAVDKLRLVLRLTLPTMEIQEDIGAIAIPIALSWVGLINFLQALLHS